MNRKIAVDFDGTLSTNYVRHGEHYDPSWVGEPIVKMINRVKRWLADGDEVEIFTARVHPKNGLFEIKLAEKAINGFCLEQFGRVLPITCMKDPEFKEFWDDRAVRVCEGDVDVYCEDWDEDDPIGSFLK